MNNYPTLRLGVLHGLAGLKSAMDAEEGYLRRQECPYDEDTVKMLEELFKPREIEVIKEVPVRDEPGRKKVGRPSDKASLNDEDAAEVEEEARAMLKDLREMGKGPGELPPMDTQTRLQIIKVQTQLMEKLVSIRERFSNVRKVAQFQATVIQILDELIDEDDREVFLQKLEPFRS